jgi:hypothetical protein
MMATAALLRAQIEASLAARIPSALTPVPRTVRPVWPTGITTVDELLRGGLPLGAITEVVGAESSGRTSFALTFLARCTQASRVCAWVDVSDVLHPESAAAAGVDLERLLWIRCGVVTNRKSPQPALRGGKLLSVSKPWSRIDQALRVTDLLLQAGGFGAILLDMGSVAPEFASRVPLATWFRYRAAAERTQSIILLLTQHPCAKSSAELLLRMQQGKPAAQTSTVLAAMNHKLEVVRQRFAPAPSKTVVLRKPVASERATSWHSHASWTGWNREADESAC